LEYVQKSRFFFARRYPLHYRWFPEITNRLWAGKRGSMIVCSCNVLSDRDVRTAVSGSEPPRTAGQVYGCLGCSPQCGRCARTIRRIMDEAMATAACPCHANGD
jgi:bacterioferritin-associated ferredoxin